MKAKVIKKSPPIEKLPINVKKEVSDTLRISHSVTISDSKKIGGEISGKITAQIAEVSAAAIAEGQKTTSKNYAEEKDLERSVEITGSENPIRVVWVNYFRTGTANFKFDDVMVAVPFEIKDDFDLIAEDIENVDD